MPDAKPPLTLYVESRKAVTTFYRPNRPDIAGAGNPGDVTPSNDPMVAEAQFYLSDDQARAVALTEEMANNRGYQLEIKDVAKAGRLERIVTEHLRGVSNFPVLVAPDGQRLEGVDQFTEDHLCELMPTEMPGQRAFTYLKIKGGNFDAMRKSLLNFGEVKEIHFLTGDWDAFVVLEFTRPTTSKRQILDFVTQRIRGMSEIIDTSTIVPEVSVTKFPI